MLALPIVVLAIAASVAWAAVTDNMFPISQGALVCMNDPDGGDGRVSCQTDGRDLSYYVDSSGTYELEAVDRAFVRDVMSTDYAPTTLVVSYDSTPTFSGSSETDIVYQEGSTNVPSSADGVTWCDDAVDSSFLACDQQVVRIRGGGIYDYGLACHETGHAVGLLHGAQAVPQLSNSDTRLGCLQTPVGGSTRLQANNTEHINSTY